MTERTPVPSATAVEQPPVDAWAGYSQDQLAGIRYDQRQLAPANIRGAWMDSQTGLETENAIIGRDERLAVTEAEHRPGITRGQEEYEGLRAKSDPLTEASRERGKQHLEAKGEEVAGSVFDIDPDTEQAVEALEAHEEAVAAYDRVTKARLAMRAAMAPDRNIHRDKTIEGTRAENRESAEKNLPALVEAAKGDYEAAQDADPDKYPDDLNLGGEFKGPSKYGRIGK